MIRFPNRLAATTLATILVVTILAAPLGGATAIPAASGAQESGTGTDTNASADAIQPGAQFAGVVGVQQAEINGSVSERASVAELASAESNASKAAIIDERTTRIDARLAELEARLAALNESREAGELNDGRYRAAVAKTVAEIRSLERELETVESSAAELPDEAFADRDVDREAIRTLRERAARLGGPETAAVARSIAGEGIGRGLGPDRTSGPPIDVGDRRGGPPDVGAGPDRGPGGSDSEPANESAS